MSCDLSEDAFKAHLRPGCKELVTPNSWFGLVEVSGFGFGFEPVLADKWEAPEHRTTIIFNPIDGEAELRALCPTLPGNEPPYAGTGDWGRCLPRGGRRSDCKR